MSGGGGGDERMATTTRSAAVLVVDGEDERGGTAAPPRPAMKKKKAASTTVTSDRQVGPIRSHRQGRLHPGGVLRSVKIGKIPVYPPLPLVRPPHRRRAWTAPSSALLAVSALLLAAAAPLLVYLPPVLNIKPVDFYDFYDSSGVYFSTLTPSSSLTNGRVDIHNEYVESIVFYRGTPSARRTSATLLPRATILFHVEMTTTPLELSVGYTLLWDLENF